jgi:hypothetical protein
MRNVGLQWFKAVQLPAVAEYRFCPPRRWRFDYAWPDHRIAIESQGGLFTGGRHVRGAALLREHEKLNAAAAAGWRIIFRTPGNLYTPETIDLLRSALKAIGPNLSKSQIS